MTTALTTASVINAESVAFAVEAVKGLRYASINSANDKEVRFALDCLPRYGLGRCIGAANAALNP